MTTPIDHVKSLVCDKLGIAAFTPMQETAIRQAAEGHDFILLSPTGSGKTLAFLIPLCAAIDLGSDSVQALIIVPSRELAQQIMGVLSAMKTGVRAVDCYGGRPAMDEHRRMRELKPQLVIGTAGRILDHLGKENFLPHAITRVVLDEFDKSLEFGFHDEMSAIFSHLHHLRQRMLTSATDMEEIPPFVAFSSHGKVLNFLDSSPTDERIRQYVVHAPENDKLRTLALLLTSLQGASCIVFVNYRESVDRVGDYLREHKFACQLFHGGMEQDDRERAIYRFRSGSVNVLVSTDLSARGLDITDVQNIIHYHLPMNEEAYIHRCGRTGRWDAEGQSFLILNPKETQPEYATDLADFPIDYDGRIAPIEPRWVTLYIGKGKKDKLSKGDILGFLCKKGGLTTKNIGMIDVKDYQSYASVERKVAKNALRLMQSEKIKGMKTKIELMKK